jgi:hypothetical protein
LKLRIKTPLNVGWQSPARQVCVQARIDVVDRSDAAFVALSEETIERPLGRCADKRELVDLQLKSILGTFLVSCKFWRASYRDGTHCSDGHDFCRTDLSQQLCTIIGCARPMSLEDQYQRRTCSVDFALILSAADTPRLLFEDKGVVGRS